MRPDVAPGLALGVLVAVTFPGPPVEAGEPIDLFEQSAETPSGASDDDDSETERPVVKSVAGESSSDDSRVPGRGSRIIELPFRREGSVILVPARVEGRPVMFVYDTGATYTTLRPGFARRAGIMPSKSAPTSIARTAGGMRKIRFGLADSISLDGHRHAGVTFSVCAPCVPHVEVDERPVVGLLGLNLLRRYENEIDESEGRVTLAPTDETANRRADVEPWLELNITSHDYRNEAGRRRLRVELQLDNRAARSIRRLELSVTCRRSEGESPTRRLESISVPARGGESVEFETGWRYCAGLDWSIRSARW
ncbi:MAG: retropepsin-like aspartic protease [Bradymonadaceae bacterium]